MDRKDLLIALKFIVDNASNAAAMQSFIGLEGEAKKLTEILNSQLALPSGINEIAVAFNRVSQAEKNANVEGQSYLQTLDKMYSPRPQLALPAPEGSGQSQKQLIGGYPALPSGYEESIRSVIPLNAQLAQGFKLLGSGAIEMGSAVSASGKAVIDLGSGIDKVQNGVLSMFSGVKQLGTGTAETGQVIDAVARNVAGTSEAFDTAAQTARNASTEFDFTDQKFAQFSDDVVARGRIIIQLMQQLGMSFTEAMEASAKMNFQGEVSGKTSPVAGAGQTPAGVDPGLFTAQVHNFVNTATGANQATNALGLNTQAEDENARAAANNAAQQQVVTVDLNKVGAAAGGARNQMRSFGAAFAGFELRFMGTQLQRFGNDLLKPIQEYVTYMGIAEQTSAQWKNAQDDLAASTRDIGKSLAEAALPAMQEMAKIASFIGDIFAKYPALGTAGVALSGITVGLGAIAQVAGTLLTSMAALRFIAPGAFTAASTALAGAQIGGVALTTLIPAVITAALPVVLAAIIAAGIVSVIWNYVTSKNTTTAKDLKAAPGELAAIVALGATIISGLIASIFTGKSFDEIKKSAEDAFMSVAKLTGVISDLDSAAKPTTQDVDAYISYLKAVKDADTQYETQRAQIIKDANQQIVDNETSFKSNMDKIAKQISDIQNQMTTQDAQDAKTKQQNAQNFAKGDAQAEASYYDQRSKASRNYNIDVQRAEEDHQHKMQQLQVDHALKIQDLLYNNDAFGILAEKRSYEKSRQEEEYSYNLQAKRKSEDFALQMSDMSSQFARERAQRFADYAQQLADQAQATADRRAQQLADLKQQQADAIKQHAIDIAKIKTDEQDKLTALDQQHSEELTKLQNDFNDQLRQLDANLLNERTLRESYYVAMSKDLETWLASMNGDFKSNLPNYPGKAEGGYLFGPTYRVAEKGDEFVLTNRTTRSMERLVGRKLTQENILNAVGARSASVSQNFRFDGDMSPKMKQWYRQIAYETAQQAMSEAFGA